MSQPQPPSPKPDDASQLLKRGWTEPKAVTFAMKVAFTVRLTAMIIWVMLAGFIALPVALVRWKNPNNNRVFGDIYGRFARFLIGVRMNMEGLEHIEAHQPCVYVANHQSGADLATLAELYPHRTLLIGKRELLYIPIWGVMFLAFGNILIKRKDRRHSLAGLGRAVDAIRDDRVSIFIFPEGTRNKSGIGLLPFKKGAFHLALNAGVPVVPIVCSSLAKLINFDRKYVIPGTLHVKVLPPISTKGRNPKDFEKLMRETHELMRQTLAELNERP